MKERKNNPCKGCGKCCYNVPIPKSYFTAFKNKIVTPFDSAVGIGDLPKMGKDVIIPETKDGRCPFLTEKNRCNIYSVRPWICREFGESKEPLLRCSILEGKEIPEQMSHAEIIMKGIGTILKMKEFKDLINNK